MGLFYAYVLNVRHYPLISAPDDQSLTFYRPTPTRAIAGLSPFPTEMPPMNGGGR